MTATKISQKHHETLARKHINFSAQKRKFTSSKALNSLSLTLIHSPTLPIPFISSICTSFTFSSGSARTMIAWAEKEHENGHTFVSRSTERSPLHARSPIFRAKRKWSEKHWKKDPHSTLRRNWWSELSRVSYNQTVTLTGSLCSYVISKDWFFQEKLGGFRPFQDKSWAYRLKNKRKDSLFRLSNSSVREFY